MGGRRGSGGAHLSGCARPGRHEVAFPLESLDYLEPILHGTRLRGDPPREIPTCFDWLGTLPHGHPPLCAVGGQLDVDDPTCRGQAPNERFARWERCGLCQVHRLVRLELRSEERVPHIRSDATDRAAALALGDSRKVVGYGGPLSPGQLRHQRECQGKDDSTAEALYVRQPHCSPRR